LKDIGKNEERGEKKTGRFAGFRENGSEGFYLTRTQVWEERGCAGTKKRAGISARG